LALGFPTVDGRAIEPGARGAGVAEVAMSPSHLARELHDLVARPLLALVLEINDFHTHNALDAELAEQLAGFEDSARNVLRNTREMLVDLRGQAELRLNFRKVLADELTGTGAHKGAAPPTLRVSTDWPQRINGWAAFNLLRIVQEAVANALRHGRASRVQVILSTSGDGEAVVVVVDDGAGLGDARSGMGMVGMQERAVILGGTFSATARHRGGTRIEVRVPLQHLR
jgi:signal transduction histidine kinase